MVVLSALFIPSCKEHLSEPKLAPQIESPILPIAVGNQWVYVDSVITISYNIFVTPWPGIDTSITVSVDTIRIVATWTYAHQMFYVLDRTLYKFPISTYFFERNDSIYGLGGVYTSDSIGLILNLIAPPQQGTATFATPEGGVSASTRNVPLNTPVGMFESHYLYINGDDSIYVVPTVGVVRVRGEAVNTHTFIRSITFLNLISYTIIKD